VLVVLVLWVAIAVAGAGAGTTIVLPLVLAHYCNVEGLALVMGPLHGCPCCVGLVQGFVLCL